MKNVLILGIGNLVLNDEGVGIHIIHILKSIGMPDGVDVLDGGMGSIELLDTMKQYKHLILIDATTDDCPAGTVRRLTPHYPKDYPHTLYAHEKIVGDMIDAIQKEERNHISSCLPSVSITHPTWGYNYRPRYGV